MPDAADLTRVQWQQRHTDIQHPQHWILRPTVCSAADEGTLSPSPVHASSCMMQLAASTVAMVDAECFVHGSEVVNGMQRRACGCKCTMCKLLMHSKQLLDAVEKHGSWSTSMRLTASSHGRHRSDHTTAGRATAQQLAAIDQEQGSVCYGLHTAAQNPHTGGTAASVATSFQHNPQQRHQVQRSRAVSGEQANC